MGRDIKGFMLQPVGPEALGWFPKPIKDMADFRKYKFRTPPGIPGQTYKDIGIASVAMGGGDILPALEAGTIDAVQSDDATMGSPVDISVFGGYFPFATRYSLDVPSLFKYYGLNEIWDEAYSEVKGVKWLSTSAWDPCHLFTVKKKVTSLADMKGLRVFGVPTAGKFLAQYGLIPVTVPWDDVEVAMQTGELDGVCWCGFTEAYEVGWADICKYALTNSVTGAWFGSYFD